MIERWSIDKCKAVRKLLGCTLTDIADRLSMTKQSISVWEHGKHSNITVSEILYTLALKDILEERGVTVEELVQQQMEELKSL